jgi:predicted acylesterase/phospholipase RssA
MNAESFSVTRRAFFGISATFVNSSTSPPEDFFLRFLDQQRRQPTTSGVVEIGIALSGGGTAGAFTAGALEFLLNALENWERHRCEFATDYPGPILRLASGSSAGALNMALLALAVASEPTGQQIGLFSRAWLELVTHIDIFGHGKVGRSHHTILDPDALETLVRILVRDMKPRPALPRYIAPDFEMICPVTNLDGVALSLYGNAAQYVEYQDYFHFVFDRDAAVGKTYLDPTVVDKWADPGWRTLFSAALASSAMPLVLPPRKIERNVEEYLASVLLHQNPPHRDLSGREIIEIPAIANLVQTKPGFFEYWATDGGLFDNQPIVAAQLGLTGPARQTPRDPRRASQITLSIDPGPRARPQSARNQERGRRRYSAWELISKITEILVSRPALSTVMSIADPENFGLFQITPKSGPTVGSLPGSALFGLAGLLSPEIQFWDFQLGAANLQAFLRESFILPRQNPVFDRISSEELLKRAGIQINGMEFLLWVPLVGDTAVRLSKRCLPIKA